MKKTFLLALLSSVTLHLAAQEVPVPEVLPEPQPSTVPVEPPPPVRVVEPPKSEQLVKIEKTESVVEENGLYRRVRTLFVFTNPNSRQMSADLEFPVPDGATVCAYALEINGTMIPGVVTEKEKARVAFESEKAKRIDPGIVEHVKGNIWKTRIFPLLPNTPRRASVDYIIPVEKPVATKVYEKDGDDIFEGVASTENAQVQSVSAKIAAFSRGVILFDASSSTKDFASDWRKRLEALPETGDWYFAPFSNTLCDNGAFVKTRAEVLALVDSLVYDGGTSLAVEKMLEEIAKKYSQGASAASAAEMPVLLFTDEMDTLDLEKSRYEDLKNVTIASRADAPARAVTVRKLAIGEALPEGVEAKASTLLATAWAADRVKDLASQAEARKDEFLAFGRKYGVASAVTSLIVLENLEQYITHKIEPHPSLAFHDEWVRRMRAEDDEIAARKDLAQHEQSLLALWEERVKWWKDPIPPKRTPKSGLFDGNSSARGFGGAPDEPVDGMPAPRAMAAAADEEDGFIDGEVVAEVSSPVRMRSVQGSRSPGATYASARSAAREPATTPAQAGGGGATITIKPWKADAEYLKKIEAASDPYAEYLKLKDEFGSSPAFFMDVASFFFSKGEGERAKAIRILSNMAEFKLEEAAVWRSMGWRLREACCYPEAILCFRHALRLRPEEGHSRRDLALVLSESGKNLCGIMDAESKKQLEEAMNLLKTAAFRPTARRSAVRSNDRQICIFALEELNALISWIDSKEWRDGAKPVAPEIDSAFRRDLPVKIRIVLSWDADETDVDLHVLEPDGEEAYYGHRRTSTGGFVSEDVTSGYGPEEYLRKEGSGVFRILANYYASHQTALTGATTVSATVYTDWGTAAEKREILTMRLSKPKNKVNIGEIKVGESAQ